MQNSYEKISILKNKIFDELDQNKHKKRFRDTYYILSDFFNDNKISLNNYTNWMVGDDNLISVLTMSLYSVMKTCNYEHIFIEYINNLLNTLKINYSPKTYLSFFDSLKNIFSGFDKNEAKMRIPQGVEQIMNCNNNYYAVQKQVEYILSSTYSFHQEYINLVTLGFYSFLLCIQNSPIKQELIATYFENLIEFCDNPDLYDLPQNCREYIEFL